MSAVRSRIVSLAPISPEIEEQSENITLLNTIRLPRNLSLLSKDLPKQKYESSKLLMQKETRILAVRKKTDHLLGLDVVFNDVIHATDLTKKPKIDIAVRSSNALTSIGSYSKDEVSAKKSGLQVNKYKPLQLAAAADTSSHKLRQSKEQMSPLVTKNVVNKGLKQGLNEIAQSMKVIKREKKVASNHS